MYWYHAVAKGHKASQRCICSGFGPSLHLLVDRTYRLAVLLPVNYWKETVQKCCLHGVLPQIFCPCETVGGFAKAYGKRVWAEQCAEGVLERTDWNLLPKSTSSLFCLAEQVACKTSWDTQSKVIVMGCSRRNDNYSILRHKYPKNTSNLAK